MTIKVDKTSAQIGEYADVDSGSVPVRSGTFKESVRAGYEPQPFDFLRNESFRQLHRLNGGLV